MPNTVLAYLSDTEASIHVLAFRANAIDHVSAIPPHYDWLTSGTLSAAPGPVKEQQGGSFQSPPERHISDGPSTLRRVLSPFHKGDTRTAPPLQCCGDLYSSIHTASVQRSRCTVLLSLKK